MNARGGMVQVHRVIGSCGKCKRAMVMESLFPEHQILCRCGSHVPVVLRRIVGRLTETPCDGRCESASGRVCACSCAGRNHGSRYALDATS